MKAHELAALKEKWETMNTKYDTYIEQFVQNPNQQLSETDIATMQNMQQELADLETTLFKAIEEQL